MTEIARHKPRAGEIDLIKHGIAEIRVLKATMLDPPAAKRDVA